MRIKPEVERDEEFKARILSSLKARYEEERVGVHATDLLWPRQAVFRKLAGSKGSRITERDVVYFVGCW